jgi:hypothetical protein
MLQNPQLSHIANIAVTPLLSTDFLHGAATPATDISQP